MFIGHVGDDAYGPVVRQMLIDADVDCSELKTASAPTAIAVIGVDAQGENAIIVASGANLSTSADQLEGHLKTGTTLLCQNEIRPDETFKAIKMASSGRLPNNTQSGTGRRTAGRSLGGAGYPDRQ